jgi:hypothetical protein
VLVSRLLTALFVCGVAATTAAASTPANDHLLVLDQRAGAYHYLDGFTDKRNPRAYELALDAFGTPSRYKVAGNLCRVTWAKAGVTIGFASENAPCATGHLYEAAWYGMTLFGSPWHTVTGIKVGGTLASVRRAFPHAHFEPGKAGWLVLVQKRDQELLFTKLAVTIDRSGRVRTIEVPAAYVY